MMHPATIPLPELLPLLLRPHAGAFGNGFKNLCPGGKTNNCIKVASWFVGSLGDATCDERCGEQRAADKCSVLERTTLNPYLHQNNSRFVDRWQLAEVQLRCPADDWDGMDPYPLPYYVPHNSTTPDIFPGKYNMLPEWPPGSGRQLLACQWQNFAMEPPLDDFKEFINMTYDLGYRDGVSWWLEQRATVAD